MGSRYQRSPKRSSRNDNHLVGYKNPARRWVSLGEHTWVTFRERQRSRDTSSSKSAHIDAGEDQWPGARFPRHQARRLRLQVASATDSLGRGPLGRLGGYAKDEVVHMRPVAFSILLSAWGRECPTVRRARRSAAIKVRRRPQAARTTDHRCAQALRARCVRLKVTAGQPHSGHHPRVGRRSPHRPRAHLLTRVKAMP